MSSTASELELKNASGSEIVRAGAGAGKTTELTNQVIQRAEAFFAEKGEMPRMVVTTFTRKATQELRERLMVRALDSKKPHLIEFVNSKSHLYVSTIHGVLEIYLKRFGAPLAIDPNFKVLNRTEASKLARKALRDVLFSNLEHQELLEAFDFKKLTLLCRQFHEVKLKSQTVQRHDLQSLYAALNEIGQNLALRIGDLTESILAEANGPKAEEWSSFAHDLKSIGKSIAVFTNVDAWPEARLKALASIESLKKPRANSKAPTVSEETSELAKELQDELCEFVETNDHDSLVLFSESFERFEKLAIEFSEKFLAMKREHGAIEISDLELLAGECIRLHGESASAFSQEWDHWLIDEYQDTSPFQVKLLSDLVGERPVFIVGDPQQSIYLFRGARSEVFKQKEDELASQGGKLRVLDKNYRSRRELLIFFNEFFKSFGSSFMPMQSHQEKPMCITEPVAKFFVAQKLEKNSDAEPRDPEFDAIVSHVIEKLNKGDKPESICVLARTRSTLVKISGLLDEAGVPVHLHASGGFYERREIQDALSLLKFLVNPHDDENLIVLLRSPWFRVTDDHLVRAVFDTKESYWSSLSRLNKIEFEAIGRLMVYLQNRNSFGMSAVFKQALIESGFVDAARIHDSSGRRESNIWKLLSRLSADEARPGFNPLQFILNTQAELRDFEGSEEGDAVTAVEPNRVNLMTIHASKGLAFDHVILPRLHESPRLSTHKDFLFDENLNRWSMRVPVGPEQKFSGSVAEQIFLDHFKKQELQEHQRVLYVALTRARHSVFMSWTEPAKKNSWLEQIRFDLNDGAHQAEEYCYEVTREVRPVEKFQSTKEEESRTRSPWKSAVASSVKQTSVTEIVEISSLKKFTRGNFMNTIEASKRGVMMHKLMEMMKYHHSTDQIKKLIELWFPDQSAEVTSAVNWMSELTEPPVISLIKAGEVEWSFAIKESGQIIEGQVDLWGKVGSQVWIIDYKTGNPDSYEKAFSQMELYSLAVRRAGFAKPDEQIQLAAVYPFSEKVFVKTASTESQVVKTFFSDQRPAST